MDAAIGNTAKFTGLSLEDVVPMASTRPAAYVGIPTAGKVVAEWDPAPFALRVVRVTV
jgi:N-acetylglucosamine-6-phosphate deacetylase